MERDVSNCPADPEEVAEAYCMGRLSPGEATAFESHSITCGKCAGAVNTAEEYVKAMRDAARALREEKR